MSRHFLLFLQLVALLQLVVALPQPPVLSTPPSSPTAPEPTALPTAVPDLRDFSKLSPFEKFDSTPDGYTDIGPAPLDTMVTVTIGLTRSNWDQFTARLLDISDPDSSNYGDHMTAEELFALIDPPEAVVDLALLWVKTAFSIDATHSHGYIKFTVSVSLLNTALGADYHIFKPLQGENIIRTLSLNIPSVLLGNVELITPGTSFDANIGFEPVESKDATREFAMNDPCDNAMNPGCLQRLYGIPTTKATQANNVLAIPGFLNQYANKNDLGLFLGFFRPDLQPTFKDEAIDGGQDPQGPNSGGLEADLDIQYTVGIASGVPVTFLSIGLSNINGFIDMANYWLNQPIPPTVVSISYGFNENQVSSNTAINLCNLFALLGARGISVMFATGDGGVAGSRPSNTCVNFVPTFPAGCPYITAVGATMNMDESGASLSAGGFSNYFSRPNYQKSQVSAYLSKLGTQYQNLFNPNGRAYPDVAAIGVNLVIAYHGQGVLVDGTSASSPIFASIVALINDRRIAKNRKALGFLNPLIYKKPHIWRDITSGSNPSCNTAGFPAKEGWDPVTGMGSPLFHRFAEASGV